MVSELKRCDLCRDLYVNSPEVASAANGSDGGADRGHSLGVCRHFGEGERLDGSTNEEESNPEGINMILYTSATRGQECADIKTQRTQTTLQNLAFIIVQIK